MATHIVDARFPAEVMEELTTNYLRVRNKSAGAFLWERHLSLQQQLHLGDDFEKAYRNGGTVGMWMRLHDDQTAVRAVIELAKTLDLISDGTHSWLLRATGEFSEDPDEAFEMALERADLVLTEDPRGVHWLGQQVEVDWQANEKLWAYFLKLCECALAGRPADAADFGDCRKPDNHTKLKYRLTTKTPGFPMDLGSRIVAKPVGRQELEVPRDRIRIIRAAVTVV